MSLSKTTAAATGTMAAKKALLHGEKVPKKDRNGAEKEMLLMAESMPRAPPPLCCLLSLSLAGSPLGAAGASILADALDDLRHLQHLSLARCNLTDRGQNMKPCWLLFERLEDELPPPPKSKSTAFGRPPPTPPSVEQGGMVQAAIGGESNTGGLEGEGEEGDELARRKGLGGFPTMGKSGLFWKMTCLLKPPGKLRKGNCDREKGKMKQRSSRCGKRERRLITRVMPKIVISALVPFADCAACI